MSERRARRSTRDNPETALHLFGATIRTLRKQRGLRQADLAATTGLPRTSISAIEHGQRNVTLLHLLHLAVALRVPPSHLFQVLDARPDLYTPDHLEIS